MNEKNESAATLQYDHQAREALLVDASKHAADVAAFDEWIKVFDPALARATWEFGELHAEVQMRALLQAYLSGMKRAALAQPQPVDTDTTDNHHPRAEDATGAPYDADAWRIGEAASSKCKACRGTGTSDGRDGACIPCIVCREEAA